ncbi:unnamed protein product [Heterobilharzia americana]|nr:unnamed protein product [Heterobilharzia americana]CAH8580177.1 unnamed protein product [Heterobilharzia americana]
MKEIHFLHSQQSPSLSSSSSSSIVNNSNVCNLHSNLLNKTLNSDEIEQENEGQKSFLISDLLNTNNTMDRKEQMDMTPLSIKQEQAVNSQGWLPFIL